MEIKVNLKEPCHCTCVYGDYGYRPDPDCIDCEGKGWYLTGLGEQLIDVLKDLGLVSE